MQRRIAAAILWFALLYPAQAHGPAEWIQRGGYTNSAGELCCGERDCGYFIGGGIKETRGGGYRVDATFMVEPPSAEPYFIQYQGFVPYNEVTPSPTGEFWLCKWGGERKCFFAPPSGS